MNVIGDDALLDGKCRGPPQRHVLADGRDHFLDVRFDRVLGARIRCREELLQIALRRRGESRDIAHECLELLVACDEVRFGVHLDNGAFPAFGNNADEAIGGNAARFLRGLR